VPGTLVVVAIGLDAVVYAKAVEAIKVLFAEYRSMIWPTGNAKELASVPSQHDDTLPSSQQNLRLFFASYGQAANATPPPRFASEQNVSYSVRNLARRRYMTEFKRNSILDTQY